MNKFVVLTTQRTGSNFLTSKITGHPDVQFFGEVFRETGNMLENPFSYYSFKRKDLKSKARSLFSKEAMADEYLDFVYNYGDKKFIGFKAMENSFMQFKELQNAFLGKDISFIRLKRKNTLKRLISFLLADKNNQWLYRKGEEVKIKSLELDKSKLKEQLAKFEKIDNFIDNFASKEKSISIYYEEITSNNAEIVKVLDFLGVENSNIFNEDTHIKKQTSNDLTEVIENFQEIEEFLKGTKYSNFLYSDSIA